MVLNQSETLPFFLLQLRRLTPILSSRDLTILALSPGRGFNSSLGSKLVFEPFFVLFWPLLFSCVSLRSRVSSKVARSSDVIAIAVGLRRSILEDASDSPGPALKEREAAVIKKWLIAMECRLPVDLGVPSGWSHVTSLFGNSLLFPDRVPQTDSQHLFLWQHHSNA